MATGIRGRALVAAEVGVEAGDWISAVDASTNLLVARGAVTSDYAAKCVSLVGDHGPYIVVAPGIALAHARPEDGALQLGLTVVRLASPVRFGHPVNDPVDLVFAFSSPDAEAHVGLLGALARHLQHGLDDALRRAATADDAAALLEEVIDDADEQFR